MTPAHKIKGGPSQAAMAAYSNEAGGRPFPLLAAHQPALGLDRSICLRDVVKYLEKIGAVGHGTVSVPKAVEREFT